MDWLTKKFHYKIVDDKGETIAYVHKKLGDLEEFALKSEFQIKSLERKGPNDFVVHVETNFAWRM